MEDSTDLAPPAFGTGAPVVSGEPVDYWFSPAVIAPNRFVYKSLSSWSYNISVGCSHGCTFCYVPSASTIKQAVPLKKYGVLDPDLEWGKYVLLRPWDERRFLASLRAAERTPAAELNRDGNRAVMLCTTTDPYQVIRHPDRDRQKKLFEHSRRLVRRALELIRDRSTLNVRILTRSPLARQDFGLFRSFGNRLVFGMSLPTLRNDLAAVYEPSAPAPGLRLATLKAAKAAGLHVYVAVAPTYPECGEADLRATLGAVGGLGPLTVFHQPINLRADNALKIAEAARASGLRMNPEVFQTPDAWRAYATGALRLVWRMAGELGFQDRLHLWPDKSLGSAEALRGLEGAAAFKAWLQAR